MQGKKGVKNKPRTLVYFGKQSRLVDQTKFRAFFRRLKSLCSVEFEDRDLSFSRDLLDSTDFLIIADCTDDLTVDEIGAIGQFVQCGGNVLIMGSERSAQSMSALTSVFGVLCDQNCVIRLCFESETESSHPKEALVSDACVSDELTQYLAGFKHQMNDDEDQSVDIMFPYGCTLDISSNEEERQHMSEVIPILSSGDLCFPSNHSLAVLVRALGGQHGTVCITGSCLMFSDRAMQARVTDNAAFVDALLEMLTVDSQSHESSVISHLMERVSGEVQSAMDEEGPLSSMKQPAKEKSMSTLDTLSNRVQPCLSVSDFDMKSVGKRDFRDWFDLSVHKRNNMFDLKQLQTVRNAYHTLNVVHRPLSLLQPRWEVPRIPLKPATFPPIFISPMPPALELFDLDSELSEPKQRISQFYGKIANKSDPQMTDDLCADLILGCADILRVKLGHTSSEHKSRHTQAKQGLELLMRELLDWKVFKPY